jgi:hypothetical protein
LLKVALNTIKQTKPTKSYIVTVCSKLKSFLNNFYRKVLIWN